MNRELTIEPLQIIKESTLSSDPYLLEQFLKQIEKISQYEIFKPFMDLVTTLCRAKRLSFVIEPKQFFHLDHGHCITIEGGVFDKFTNAFRSSKRYKISIKKISADVIIHEIGHMVEKECSIKLDDAFKEAIAYDMSYKHSSNVSLQSAMKDIMVSELAGYPDDHKLSELFTRFFQIMALAKEVSGLASPYGYRVSDVYKAFPKLNAWLVDILFSVISKFVDEDIAKLSKKYIKAVEDIEHKWSEEKVSSFHKTSSTSPKKWSGTVKSIDD